MKALILAAGFGTRLLPFTKNTPKALFPVAGRPLLHIIILSLQNAGCKAVIINTHHLYKKIDSYLLQQKYAIPVITRYEPEILGTGGAIKNVADFWDDNPFMVINSDIFTDIDLKKVYDFHLNHSHPVTLVLHDDPQFNSVPVNKNGVITDFHDLTPLPSHSVSVSNIHRPGETEKLTFTGIQVLDPQILELIPDNIFSSSIDIYRQLISENKKVCAFIAKEYQWKDIGSPERYNQVVFGQMAPEAFKYAFPSWPDKKIFRAKLKGDGSDRNWYRLTSGNRSLVMADHNIRKNQSTSEVDSFVAIGRHLHDKDVPVPEIYLHDTFSGLVFMEDLGDVNLQTLVLNTENPEEIISYYKSIIGLLGKLSATGAKGFDPVWTYQTSHYNQDLILEKECRYFVDAFLRKYIGMNISFKDLEDEFRTLADKALEFSVNGFMHRDMQSRNIMVKNNRFYFIDFQGGRLGPVQYDLASLLIDPYVELSPWVRNQLLNFSGETLPSLLNIDPDNFLACYKYCSITRNLQILGAFAYLSRIKGKRYFEKYIPHAIQTLKHNLSALKNRKFSKIESIVRKIGGAR
ncbi:MAG: sugar phosphate nucleotidyltransferase [Thermodesulfobacteriota bacterium]|nr:sugar phosphate nucleotidyltransferase [Thermodesulfobacteriota bacterium]